MDLLRKTVVQGVLAFGLMCICTSVQAAKPYRISNMVADGFDLRSIGVDVRIDERGVGIDSLPLEGGMPMGVQGGALGVVLAEIAIHLIASADPAGLGSIANALQSAIDSERLRVSVADSVVERMTPVLGPDTRSKVHPVEKAVGALQIDSETPVLNLEFEYALTYDFRSAVVVLTATMVSKSNGIKRGKEKYDVLYKNRFAFYSDRLDPLNDLSRSQIEECIDLVRARYPARRQMTESQMVNFEKERRQECRPLEPGAYKSYLINKWLLDDAFLLNASLHEGVAKVMELMSRDLVDTADVAPRVGKEQQRLVEVDQARSVIRYMAGPYAGSLASVPRNYEPLGKLPRYYRKIFDDKGSEK